MSTFQENLKKYRERLGITAKDFAAEVGIKYGTYISYETAGKEPKYDTLCKIASALHVSIDDLLGYKVDNMNKIDYWLNYLNSSQMEISHGSHHVAVALYDRPLKSLKLNEVAEARVYAEFTEEEFLEIMDEIEHITTAKAEADKKNKIKRLVRDIAQRKMIEELSSKTDKDMVKWAGHLRIKRLRPQDTPDTKKSPTD